ITPSRPSRKRSISVALGADGEDPLGPQHQVSTDDLQPADAAARDHSSTEDDPNRPDNKKRRLHFTVPPASLPEPMSIGAFQPIASASPPNPYVASASSSRSRPSIPETSPARHGDDSDPYAFQPLVFRPIEPVTAPMNEPKMQEREGADVTDAIHVDARGVEVTSDGSETSAISDPVPYPTPTITPFPSADVHGILHRDPPSGESVVVDLDAASGASSALEQENLPSDTAPANTPSTALAFLPSSSITCARNPLDVSAFHTVHDASSMTPAAIAACAELDAILAAPVELDEAQQRARTRRGIIDRELARGEALALMRANKEDGATGEWKRPVSDARRERLRCADVPVSFRVTTRDLVVERQVELLVGMWEEGQRRRKERNEKEAVGEERSETVFAGDGLLRRPSGLGDTFASSPLLMRLR
ncbi:hypothetical protein HK101_011902, partial [Irineochytrium annulatum]